VRGFPVRAFQLWEIISPTLITIFLYVKAVQTYRIDSDSSRIHIHVAWLMTLLVVLWLGIQTLLGYYALDDAPRGLLFDIYQFTSLMFGALAFWISYGIGSAAMSIKRRANKPRQTNRRRQT
jgi:hypothetical protein